MLAVLVADPISIGSKRELAFSVVFLVRRNPFGDHESESGLTFPCLTRAEGQPNFVLYCRESVAPIGRRTADVLSCVKGPFVCNLFYTFHCKFFPFVNILVLLADLLQRCEIWVRLRASNRLHRLRALASATQWISG